MLPRCVLLHSSCVVLALLLCCRWSSCVLVHAALVSFALVMLLLFLSFFLSETCCVLRSFSFSHAGFGTCPPSLRRRRRHRSTDADAGVGPNDIFGINLTDTDQANFDEIWDQDTVGKWNIREIPTNMCDRCFLFKRLWILCRHLLRNSRVPSRVFLFCFQGKLIT